MTVATEKRKEKTISEVFSTNDIAIAAYLFQHKFSLIRATRDSGSKFTFCFDDADGNAEEMVLSFMNSESRDFDAAMRSLKSLCHTKSLNI